MRLGPTGAVRMLPRRLNAWSIMPQRPHASIRAVYVTASGTLPALCSWSNSSRHLSTALPASVDDGVVGDGAKGMAGPAHVAEHRHSLLPLLLCLHIKLQM